MKRQKILALDCARTTGFACGYTDEDPVYGRKRVHSESDGAFAAAFRDWLVELINELQPTRVYVEQPFGSNHKGLGLVWTVAELSHRARIGCVYVASQSWRKYFLGKGRGFTTAQAKKLAIDQCRRRGWDPIDDNVADALGIWEYGVSLVNPNHAARFALSNFEVINENAKRKGGSRRLTN